MRASPLAALAFAFAGVLGVRSVHAEPLPPAVIELIGGATSGAGADAKTLGFGYVFGAQAAWQPMSTERRWGWSVRWSTLFGGLYNGRAEQVNPPLRTVQMDGTLGLRFRPWATPARYLTARAGIGLLRLNDPVRTGNTPESGQREFVGPVAAVGVDQYLGSLVLGLDLRAGLLANGPAQLAVVVRVGWAGP
jgi:hypothetical protein